MDDALSIFLDMLNGESVSDSDINPTRNQCRRRVEELENIVDRYSQREHIGQISLMVLQAELYLLETVRYALMGGQTAQACMAFVNFSSVYHGIKEYGRIDDRIRQLLEEQE